MNAGLSNLTLLKAAVLPASLRSSTEFDAAITAIGLGVAAQMERHCDRQFARLASGDGYAIYYTRGGVFAVGVDRYPIESIHAIEMLPSGASAWETETDSLSQFYAASGLVEFSGVLGTHLDKLRITFTGGWWWRTLEPEDAGYSASTLPTGATAPPDDVLHAWHLQCQNEIERSDLLRSVAARGDEASPQKNLISTDLLPTVVSILRGHRRHAV